MTQLPELTYDTPIRAASWGEVFFARTFTVAGYSAKNGRDPAEAVENAKKRGHELVGSIYTGAVLLGDPVASAAHNKHLREVVALAVTLKTGDVVLIDGVKHTVRFADRNEKGFAPVNSDPIHFKPVTE